MKKIVIEINCCFACFIAAVVINATDARPVLVYWRDPDVAHEVPPGHLHRLVTTDPLGSAILRGLRDGEQGRARSEVSGGARRYKAGEWARLGHMGYTGAEDEGIWARMMGRDWEGEEAVKEDSCPPPPPQGQTTTSQTPSHQNA